MIPKEIIEVAIKGGWRGTIIPREDGTRLTAYGAQKEFHSNIALSPDFWRALGKELGWPDESPEPAYFPYWHNTASYFFDLILTNQPTEPFWQSLLIGEGKV